MTLLRHELRQGRTSFAIWTGSVAFLLAVCVFLFPEMKGEMEQVGNVFATMGSFTAAFGMDRLNFGTLVGFYSVECGNVLGLGGAFFSSLTAISILAKEEKDRTAEFLLAHPISRGRVVAGKLWAVMLQILAMNAVLLGVSLGSMALVGEEIPWKEICLLHLAYLLMQVELGSICFGLSAFLRRGSLGIGLGLAAMMYFLNLIANLTESAGFLKYITPFGYCEGADIVSSGSLDGTMVLLGMLYALAALTAGFLYYRKKDLQ